MELQLSMASNVKNSNLIVGLDIGTSKVVCIVGKYNESNHLEIVALGSYPSSGLKRGIVVNIDATTDAIKKAVDQAQSMIDEKIKNVFVGIAGNHVKSLNSHGTHGIKDNAESAMKNIEKCVRNCGLTVERFVLEQLASSYSILSEDEKDLGVCLVDIGGGTTDIAIFKSGAIQFTGVLPIAGDQVTSDIAQALRTPTPQAEEIKQKHGCALSQFTRKDETIEVQGVGGRPPVDLSRAALSDIIQPRYTE